MWSLHKRGYSNGGRQHTKTNGPHHSSSRKRRRKWKPLQGSTPHSPKSLSISRLRAPFVGGDDAQRGVVGTGTTSGSLTARHSRAHNYDSGRHTQGYTQGKREIMSTEDMYKNVHGFFFLNLVSLWEQSRRPRTRGWINTGVCPHAAHHS